MFESYDDARGFSPGLFLVQFVVAPLGGLALGLVAYIVLEEFFRTKNNLFLGYFGFSIQGFILGFKLQKAFPRAIESGGRWVWIPPVINLSVWILRELERGSNSQAADFFASPGIQLILITWPAIASCSYSIGIHAASKPPQSSWGKRLRRAIVRDPSSGGQTEPTPPIGK